MNATGLQRTHREQAVRLTWRCAVRCANSTDSPGAQRGATVFVTDTRATQRGAVEATAALPKAVRRIDLSGARPGSAVRPTTAQPAFGETVVRLVELPGARSGSAVRPTAPQPAFRETAMRPRTTRPGSAVSP